MLPSRKKMPITISTIGPARERGWRGRMGGGGTGGMGGVLVALAIFHLAVDFAGRLLRRRNIAARGRSRHGCSRIAVLPAAFHEFDHTNHQQNDWPGPSPSRHAPPAIMQIVQQRQQAYRDQHCGTGKTAVAHVAAVVALLA